VATDCREPIKPREFNVKLPLQLLISHAVVVLASLVSWIAFGGDATGLVAAAIAGGVAAVGGAMWLSQRISGGLRAIESVVADHEHAESLSTGVHEIDATAKRISEMSARWEQVASETRSQSRDFHALVTMLDRREGNRPVSSGQLRRMLVELGSLLQQELERVGNDASEIQLQFKTIADGVDTQGQAVIKTTTYVEQLSSTIDAVSNHAAAAGRAVERNGKSASAALVLVREMIDSLKLVRGDAQNNEKKLRGLCDPTQQITSIVTTIGDIAARTDLLALNASIESIRAGEHGRGFAIVADEVRKLAEQATDATREIEALLDSMQLVTQESIRGVEIQRERVQAELERATNAHQALEKMCELTDQDANHIRQIADTSTKQLQLAQDVIGAVEQISEIARTNRSGAESVHWATKSLSQINPHLRETIGRLRACDGSVVPPETVESPATHGAPIVHEGSLTTDLTPVA